MDVSTEDGEAMRAAEEAEPKAAAGRTAGGAPAPQREERADAQCSGARRCRAGART